jgi:phosphoribosylglycinamide formyltransferase-1
MKNIAVFASGSGSNAEQIVEYFTDSEKINVKLFLKRA